jgi:hypothetical protein
MTLKDIRDLYLSVLPDATFHYEAWQKTDQYIVWAEDGQGDTSHADDKMQDQVIQGTIDYFTKEEYDPNFDLIQRAMNDAEISWELNSIQHEEDTGYIHYEWVWEVENSVG